MHILLVEDDPMIGEAVREALTDEGYDVLWAKSGWEAGGMLAAGTFDVVFLDLGLPGRDGMALLRDLRTKDTATPVWVMTARDALEDETPESNALEFILYGLRKKLGAGVIRNIRGLGWMAQKEKAA